ncbi:MAG TPA: hypothetical protein VJI97_02830 [Candidatus Nanoarchaeia archaeon]|nr:hypothetical protein [Candidatus Nanoarchaeia archaeon]
MMRVKCDGCGKAMILMDYSEVYLCAKCKEEIESKQPLLVEGHLKWNG